MFWNRKLLKRTNYHAGKNNIFKITRNDLFSKLFLLNEMNIDCQSEVHM